MQLKLKHSRIICLLVIACICTLTSCRPSDPNLDAFTSYTNEYNGELSAETVKKLEKCYMDSPVMELCMRCAKITKSYIVYPLCCGDEDDVQNWCKRYLLYGQDSSTRK